MITEQLDACDSLDSCVGTVMYDYEFFSSDNSLASAILKYIAERSREELERTLNSEILRAARRPQTNRK